MRSMCIHVHDVCIYTRIPCPSLIVLSFLFFYVRCVCCVRVCVCMHVCVRVPLFFFFFLHIRYVHTFAVHMHHRLYVCLSTCVALSLLNCECANCDFAHEPFFHTFCTLKLIEKTLRTYIYIYKTYISSNVSNDFISRLDLAVARQPYRHRGFSSFPLLGDGVHAIYI